MKMIVPVPLITALVLFAVGLPGAAAKYQLDTPQQILDSARTLAVDGMTLYQGNKTGLLSEKEPPNGAYYWWQGSVFLSTYIDYWRRTGDNSYNQIIVDGLLAQAGEGLDYQPASQRASLANSDQCAWGIAAMLAAESKVPGAGAQNGKPDLLALARAVFDTQAARFDAEKSSSRRNQTTCGGGLRWVVSPINVGYNVKDSFSNVCFMNLAARLAKLTSNQTYADYSQAAWQWMWDVKLIDHNTWALYDGVSAVTNCSEVTKLRFSAASATLIEGAAIMYNHTKGTVPAWRDRTEKLMNETLHTFFPRGVAVEVACERAPSSGSGNSCVTDMIGYKAIAHRALSSAADLAPAAAAGSGARTVLLSSAKAAVAQCTGGESGRKCGFEWEKGTYVEPPKGAGVLEQVGVLAAVAGLVEDRPGASGGGQAASGTETTGTTPGEMGLRPSGAQSRFGSGSALMLGAAFWVACMGF